MKVKNYQIFFNLTIYMRRFLSNVIDIVFIVQIREIFDI